MLGADRQARHQRSEGPDRVLHELDRHGSQRAQLRLRFVGVGECAREQLQDALADVVGEMLSPPQREDQLIDVSADPSVILVVGVNGTGKTTTIGKLAYRLHQPGKSPLMGAADTFRPAASAPRRVASLVARRASGEIRASRRARRSVAGHSSARGTTRLTRP